MCANPDKTEGEWIEEDIESRLLDEQDIIQYIREPGSDERGFSLRIDKSLGT